MPHDNFTYNHLPYGEYAQSAYDGIQNFYGNALDDGMNSVIDYVNPQPDMMSGGPMSRNGYRHEAGGVRPANSSFSNASYDANMPGTMMVQDNFIPSRGPDFVPYQETDTGTALTTKKPKSDWAKWKASMNSGRS